MSRNAGNFLQGILSLTRTTMHLWMAQVFLAQSISSSGQREGDICGGVANAIMCDVCWRLGPCSARRWEAIYGGALDVKEHCH